MAGPRPGLAVIGPGPGAVRAGVGMVHGRFQPFHNGHLEYLRGAAACSARLVVGITNPDRRASRIEAADPARHRPEANPFTYAERAEMVHAVLAEERIDGLVVPFPIGEPELWPDYVAPGTVHFLRVFDEWGRVKLARLRSAGYEVIVLDEGARKTLEGTRVRELMRRGGAWEPLVPPAVARVIRSPRSAHAPDLRRTG